jgi:hypothetical protein
MPSAVATGLPRAASNWLDAVSLEHCRLPSLLNGADASVFAIVNTAASRIEIGSNRVSSSLVVHPSVGGVCLHIGFRLSGVGGPRAGIPLAATLQSFEKCGRVCALSSRRHIPRTGHADRFRRFAERAIEHKPENLTTQ